MPLSRTASCASPLRPKAMLSAATSPATPLKTRVVGVVIGRCVLLVHSSTLTVEPDFKSSGNMSEPLLTIGEVAERAGVATSTIRYYERLNLLVADARASGQRRYRVTTLRKLVFIGMLQDAGLALVDIAGILDAADVSEWKSIATRRLEVLDEEIATLLQARAYLSGALHCRYDHPATDCKIMGAEIDRRLSVGQRSGVMRFQRLSHRPGVGDIHLSFSESRSVPNRIHISWT